MKLVNKITLWFIGIVLLTTPLCMYISYSNIKTQIDNAEINRMKSVNDNVARQLRLGAKTDKYTLGRAIEIEMIKAMPAKRFDVSEKCFKTKDLKRQECKLTVNSYYTIGGSYYRITSYNYVTKAEQILAGMKNGILAKMLVIILAFAIAARLLSRYIFRSFKQTIAAVHEFSITKRDKIVLPQTNTHEFKELNLFLQKMTDKAIEDYSAAKEFTENASHEIQTPLAVIRSKIELLAETAIDQNQADLITEMQIAIEKLSRINRSLSLLTKLENQEYEIAAPIKFCRITKNIFSVYSDLISMKNITLTADLDKDIVLEIHPDLADILVSNLLSNAIRHNFAEYGTIDVKLTRHYFCVCNSGTPPVIPTHELFQRFKKSNQCDESIGLGLAIVKQICEVNDYTIQYEYINQQHCMLVCFEKENTLALSQLLPVADAPVSISAVA